MQKSWYILYTKPGFEKKVSNFLTKKKIENFLPVNTWTDFHQRKTKTFTEVLFPSYVFVHIEISKLNFLKSIEDAFNLVYWKKQPAIISEHEIELIKEAMAIFQKIKVERIGTGCQEYLGNETQLPNLYLEGKVLLVRNRLMKINLPSLGLALIAQAESAGMIIDSDILSLEKKVQLQ